MIAIDTNILLRFSVADDPKQGKLARDFLDRLASDGGSAFVSAVTLVEFAWVLQRRYGVARAELPEIIKTLLDVPCLVFEHEPAILQAIASSEGNFSDRLIHFVGAASGCDRTCTFDRKFARLAGVDLLKPN